MDFLKNEAKVSACTQAMLASKLYYRYHGETQITGLYITAYFRLMQSTAALLAEKHSPSPKDMRGRTSVHYAADRGHQEVVKLLLRKGTKDCQ